MEVTKWTKRLDVMHYHKTSNLPNICTTLCGKVMLGNNYAEENPDREDCKECIEKLMEMKR